MRVSAMPRLALLLLVLGLMGHGCLGRFMCPNDFPCNCMMFDKNDFRLHCATRGSSFDLSIQPGEQVRVQCNGAPGWGEFLNAGRLQLGRVDSLAISGCSPLGPKTYDIVIQRLGIDKVQDLRYENIKGKLRPSDLDVFPELKFLELSENTLDDVDPDLLKGLQNLTYLGLRSTNIKLQPGFFSRSENLKTIELSFNNIHSLQPGVFNGLSRVEQMNLWMNKLRELPSQVFQGLGSLAILDLNRNQLTGLPVDIFADLANLQVLNLNMNNLTSLPAGLFRSTPRFHSLKLMKNQANLTELPSGLLAELTQLTLVNLRRVGLHRLPEDLFRGSTGLEELDLGSNFLAELPIGLLRDATVLRKLSLDYNELVELPDLFFARCKGLKKLDISFNRIAAINENTFEGLKSLNELNMEDNGLTYIHEDAFRDLEELQIAKFANNKLTMFTEFMDIHGRSSPFHYCLSLQELYLANNNVSELFGDWIITDMQLHKLDLSNNSLKELRAEDLQFISDKLELDLRHNQIAVIDLKRLEQLVDAQGPVNLGSRNVQVFLDDNPIQCGCEAYSLLRYASGELTAAALQYARLVNLTELQCAGPEEMRGLRLGSLRPGDLRCRQTSSQTDDPCGSEASCDCWFRPADKTFLVNCSDMGLTQPPKWLDAHGAQAIELDLRDNLLTQQPDMQAPGYEMLQSLDLGGNKIAAINASLITPKLKILKLDGNNLTSIDKSVLDKLTSNDSHINELTLHDNPIRCNCEARDLTAFILSQRIAIPSLLEVYCGDRDLLVSDVNYAELCYEPWLYIILALTISSLLLSIFFALYYRFQPQIKVWLYSKELCLCLVTEDELDRDKTYDAFISYSHKDEDFVVNELLTKLEDGPRPYKICIHTRDWLAGEWIPDQIKRSVDDSRRTIVVLSDNFIESVWSKFEFQVAHKQALKEKRARVIIVLLGEIGPLENIDPDLRAYLQMNTYVKWGDPWFWQKLSYAMPHNTRANQSEQEEIKKVVVFKNLPEENVAINI